jgi:hypothetical protein
LQLVSRKDTKATKFFLCVLRVFVGLYPYLLFIPEGVEAVGDGGILRRAASEQEKPPSAEMNPEGGFLNGKPGD